MRLESLSLLHDVREAATRIREFVAGRSFEEYSGDEMVRSAVERQFEIIGEALRRLTRDDPETARRIPDTARIIAFRNILVHAYAQVDDRIVWDVVNGDLPSLVKAVAAVVESDRSPQAD